jgi:glycosyltransferase involved in cell wall biosynthesis
MNNNIPGIKHPLISIIVPVYNAESTVEKCVDSIVSQDYQNIEIILVDDGSIDRSLSIIERLKSRDNRILIFHQENQGQNAARKLGLEHASGNYVAFVDSDDTVRFDFCSKLLGMSLEYQADIVGCGIEKISVYDNAHQMICPDFVIYSGHQAAESLIDVEEFYHYYHATALCSYLFSYKIIYSIFKNIDLRIRYAEDAACIMMALWDAGRVCYIPDALYQVNLVRGSVMRAHNKSYYKSLAYLYRYGMQQMQYRSMSSLMYRQMEYLIMFSLLITSYGEAFDHLDWLYPFDGVHEHSKVTIYGAGAFGIELVRYILKSNRYILAQWIDQKAEQMENGTFPVEKPDDLDVSKCDYLVIAVTSPKTSDSILRSLKQYSINEGKIRSICQKKISYRYLRQDFFETD